MSENRIIRNMFPKILFLFLICIHSIFYSQNIKIKGKAHSSYKGKKIELLSIQDHITGLRQKEASDTIQTDGYFELNMQSNYTQPVILRINNVIGKLYVSPDFVYGITIPELEQAADYRNDAELEVNIGVIGKDSTELNALIFDYQRVYNSLFLSVGEKYLSRPLIFRKADSLQLICDKRYAKIKNPYFKSYYQYSIASINASVSRGENYLIGNYIQNKAIQYHHAEYMNFFNSCFSGYLKTVASSRKGETLFNIINVKGDYHLLNEFMLAEKTMKNDSLRELVIIKNLWELYYSAEFDPNAVRKIVSDINVETKIEKHREITAHMLGYFNKMQNGSPAPMIKARNKTGGISDLVELKGKWIYLNFFSTKKTESAREMYKIASLKKKMGDRLLFVSICTDDSLSTYTGFIKANPKLDWNIWYNSDKRIQKNAKESYFVTGSEAYFLIDNNGYLAQSPALSPSGGIEYKLNSIFKPVRKNIKTGIR